MANEERHPTLARLDILAGRWTVQPTVEGFGPAWTEFTWHARGVRRVYAMTFGDGTWTMWRNAPGFHQRFAATLDRDGNTADGRWETSRDGQTWNLDFEVGYARRT